MTSVLFLGNFRPEASTERDILDALQRLNVDVVTVQEDDWVQRRTVIPDVEPDMVLWTRTWPAPADVAAQLDRYSVPRVLYHLDRWTGLKRMADVYTDPYWQKVTRFYTADPQTEHWQRAGIETVWTPPAVSERWLTDPDPVDRYGEVLIAFVGNYRKDSYHSEHVHRFDMLDQLTQRYGRRFNVFPPPGQTRIIGQELAELYVSIPVIIGDSCLVGLDNYWSDRVPETVGRGGYLLHPWTHWQNHYEPGTHLDCWRIYDWPQMFTLIDRAIGDAEYRQTIAAQGAVHVRETATYTVRLKKVLEEVVL